MESRNDNSDLWGEPIHVYSRAQAIADGILVDFTTATDDQGQLLCPQTRLRCGRCTLASQTGTAASGRSPSSVLTMVAAVFGESKGKRLSNPGMESEISISSGAVML